MFFKSYLNFPSVFVLSIFSRNRYNVIYKRPGLRSLIILLLINYSSVILLLFTVYILLLNIFNIEQLRQVQKCIINY